LPGGEDNPAPSAIRNLAQDGHLRYQVTIRTETGGGYGAAAKYSLPTCD